MINRHRLIRTTGNSLSYAIFLAVFVVVIFPMVWMFYISFKE